MGTKLQIFFLSLVISVSFFLNGCASESTYLVNLSFVKAAIVDYHESGQYQKDAEKAISEAIKEFDEITPGEKSAVIFDVDETALSNYSFNKDWDFGYIGKYFDIWIDSAKAPPISEVLKLYNYLLARNFKIVFITARKVYQYNATYKNLLAAGYTIFDTLIVKDNKYHGVTSLVFKSDKRKELTENGYSIAATVGDQWSDLDGPFHGIQVKIPNYQYFIP